MLSVLASGGETATIGPWRAVTDGVMGGVSSGALHVDGGTVVITGTLRSDNSGGFVSFRAPLLVPLREGVTAVQLRVRGDGKRYQFRVRTADNRDGEAYKLAFATEVQTWMERTLPFARFVVSRRGRLVAGAPNLAADRATDIGFLVADKQFGPFRLEVEWIRAVVVAESPG